MAEDREILKEVWQGKLPICFKLSSTECISTEPEEVYLMISRQTYFPLVMDKVIKYFAEFVNISNRNNDVWLDFKGVALKLNYPVGLLFDLLANEGNESTDGIPWQLTVHFDNYPSELIRFNNKTVIESYFISTIKEADFLKHKGKVINEMLKDSHKQLWNGVLQDNFEQFWAVNRKLMDVADGECFRSIPVRVYQNNQPFVQRLFEPVTETGKKKTLADLLQFLLGDKSSDYQKVLIQGIRPSLETPVQWLSEHLSYPDNFLHVCLK